MTPKESWVEWLTSYGIDKFFDAFMATAQGAQGRCQSCGEFIYLDIVEGGGVPDWHTDDGDYGCDQSSDTSEGGVGSHTPMGVE